MSASRNRILELVSNNEKYASNFKGAPEMTQIQARAKSPGASVLAILTCIDPRCVPEAFFGPDLQAAVFRNAGGRATEDAVRGFNILRALINLKLVAVVHHTDCGMGHITAEEVRAHAKVQNPAAAEDVEKIDFGLWKEEHLEETVREDVQKLKAEKSLDGMEVLGFVLDTRTGAVREIES